MKLAAMLLGITVSGWAQVISVGSPTANQVVSGFQFNLNSACSSCPSIYSTEYDVDGELAGITRTAPYSFQWNTYYAGNGTHTVQAIARDALNNIVAASSPVTFKIENNLPEQTCATTCSDISVSQQFAASMTVAGSYSGISNLVGFRGSSPAIVNSNVSANSNVVTLSVTTGNAVLVYLGPESTSTSASVSDSQSNPYTCQTVRVGPFYNGAFCWSFGVTGASPLTITTSSSGAGSYDFTYAIQLSGVSSVDVNNGNTGLVGNTFYSPSFTPNPTELVFYGAHWGGVNPPTFSTGYTGLTYSGNRGAVGYHNYTNLSLAGPVAFTITTNGVPSATKDTYIFIDGSAAISHIGDASSSITQYLDSTQFANGSHQVVIDQFNETNCTGCINGTWSWIGGWEQTLSFANGAMPMELRASATEIVLTPTGSAGNCTGGSSCALTGVAVNTDGSTSAAAISSCSSSNPAVFTVTGTCTVNAQAVGFAQNTMTDSVGRTRVTQVYVLTANTVPHFESNGTVSNGTYDANSILHNSLFFSGDVAMNLYTPAYPASAFFSDYASAGFNTFEYDSAAGAGVATSGEPETTWDAAVSAAITNVANAASTHNMHVHLISDGFFRGSPEMFSSQYGPCSAYVTPCFQYVMQKWTTAGVVLGHSGVDEVSSAWGGNPLQGLNSAGLKIGSWWSSVTGNGSSCQFAGVTTPMAMTGANTFIINGTGQSALDFNAAANTNLFQNNSNTISNSSSFPCSFNGTFNTGSTATIEPYVAWPFNSSLQACSPGGSGSPPCPNYIKYDVFKSIRNQLTSVTNFPGMTWPTPAGSTGYIGQWAGAVSVIPLGSSTPLRMADYWEAYWSLTGGNYLPGKVNLQALYSSQVGSLYSQLPYIQLSAPILEETTAITSTYAFQGYSAAIASCSGNTITFSAPHGISNLVVGASRLWIPNSSGACNNGASTTLSGSIGAGATSLTVASGANFTVPAVLVIDQETKVCYALNGSTFSSCTAAIVGSQNQAHASGAAVVGYIFDYIVAAPTATTLQVATVNPTTIANGSGGTVTFDDGSTYSIGSESTSNLWATGSPNSITLQSCPTTFGNHFGHQFTISGSSASYFNTTKFFLNWDVGYNCNPFNNHFFQMENFAPSSGGTATILPDNNYVRGRNWSNNSDFSSTEIFASNMLTLLTRTGGKRGYGWAPSPQYYDPTSGGWSATAVGNNRVFANYDLGGVAGGYQGQINAKWDYARTAEAWNAITNANLISSRLLKFVFQAEMPAPDYGRFFATTARTGQYGNLLMVQSLADAPVSLTVNLGSYLVSGQQIIRECSSGQGMEAVAALASGTLSDSFNYRPGEFCAYLFPVNAAAEYSPTIISANVGDVAGATKVVVQFSYTASPFLSPSVASQSPLPAFDCGTGTCALPVDARIAPVWYRLLYLNSSSALLASSDIQLIGVTQ